MARSTVTFDQPRGDWAAWAKSLLTVLVPTLNKCQKTDEEFEPPHALGVASRLVLASPNGTRYALTVSDAGATVWTAL